MSHCIHRERIIEGDIVVTDKPPGFFEGTVMPNAGWSEASWPDPAGPLTKVGIEGYKPLRRRPRARLKIPHAEKMICFQSC
jgi:hypothetical protein